MGLIHHGMKYDRNHKDGDKCPDLKSIFKVELTGLGDWLYKRERWWESCDKSDT